VMDTQRDLNLHICTIDGNGEGGEIISLGLLTLRYVYVLAPSCQDADLMSVGGRIVVDETQVGGVVCKLKDDIGVARQSCLNRVCRRGLIGLRCSGSVQRR
jgi:hypothetical protein